MSQVMSKLNQIAGKINNRCKTRLRPSKSTSSQVQSWTVRDSRPSRSQTTNNAAGTFSGLMLSIAILGTSLLSSMPTNASSTIRLTVSSGDATTNVTQGNYNTSSPLGVSIWTDHYTGYNFSIYNADDDNGKLVGVNNSSNFFKSINTSMSADNFNALDNCADTYPNCNGYWGIIPSSDSKSSDYYQNNNYYPSPAHTASTELDDTSTCSSASTSGSTTICDTTFAEEDANNYTLTLAAKADTTAPVDSYAAKFVVAAVGNALSYDISFVDAAADMPTSLIGTDGSTGVVLPANVPTKPGYTFKGWCSEATIDATCSGDTYQPGGTYTLSQSSSNQISLYAIWAPNMFSISTMQQMTSNICANTTTPTASAANVDYTGEHTNSTAYVPRTTLIDTRDGKPYLVSKLADGNCWMSQNLELTFYTNANGTGYASTAKTNASSVASGVTQLNSSNTDIASGTTYNVSSFYATQSVAGSDDYSWSDDGNDKGHSFSWSAYDGAKAYAVPTGTKDTYGRNEYQTSASGAPEERAGNLYNWTMATLGSGKDITADHVEAPDSICPKGWQLPTNDTDDENTNSLNYSFYNLTYLYNGNSVTVGNPQSNTVIANEQNTMRSFPLNFVVSGVYHINASATLTSRNREGTFWSATSASSDTAHYMASYTNSFNPQGAPARVFGYPIRCVAR